MNDSNLLRAALALTLVAGAVAMGYVAVTPSRSDESYSELYLLNERGVAADYPADLAVGDDATVVVGVGNRRPTAATYAVAVTLGDRAVTDYAVTVPPDETRERAVTFTASDSGTHVLRARLYRGPDATGEPLHTVRVTITARA